MGLLYFTKLIITKRWITEICKQRVSVHRADNRKLMYTLYSMYGNCGGQ